MVLRRIYLCEILFIDFSGGARIFFVDRKKFRSFWRGIGGSAVLKSEMRSEMSRKTLSLKSRGVSKRRAVRHK